MPANEAATTSTPARTFFHRLSEAGSTRKAPSRWSLPAQRRSGFPGNAVIQVTYALKRNGALHILYKPPAIRTPYSISPTTAILIWRDTTRPAEPWSSCSPFPGASSTPTTPKTSPPASCVRWPEPHGFPRAQAHRAGHRRGLRALKLQGGYDHNWEVFCNPCATLSDPVSGRSMSVCTDCPGIQLTRATS